MVPCEKFVYKNQCVNECPTKIDGTNVVDVNMNCLDSIGTGYKSAQADYTIFYPQCKGYMVLDTTGNSFTCIETCTNAVLDAKGTKICLDSYTCT